MTDRRNTDDFHDDVMVDVWQTPLVVDSPRLARLKATLSPEDSRRARHFRFDDDRTRWTIARGFVREVLGQYLMVQPWTIAFETGRWGKPALHRASNPQLLEFNYSHSQDSLLLAVTFGYRIGIDIERGPPQAEILDIAAHHFSPTEYSILRRSAAPEETFLRCWSAKEAVAKALGAGLSIDLPGFTTLLDEASLVEEVRLRDPEGYECSILVNELDVGSRSHAAVAVIVEPDRRIALRWRNCRKLIQVDRRPECERDRCREI
jgi:4'-phosphopantetheinyl transferase